jgi:hypothetical protein
MTSSEAALNDEELIKALRDRTFLTKSLEGLAADRIEQLVATNEQLVSDNHRWKGECEEFWRKREDAADSKLGQAFNVIACMVAIAPDGNEDDNEWHIILDTAKDFLDELEKAE